MDSVLKDSLFADAIITRICHDLINSVGTAQLAFDENELAIASSSLKQAVAKLEIFRTVFKSTVNSKKAMIQLEEFIELNNLNCTINKSIASSGLQFFLLQKMLGKSSAKFENDEIILTEFFLTDDEIDALQGKFNENSRNILAYLVYLQMQNSETCQTLTVEKLEEKSWKIKIQQ